MDTKPITPRERELLEMPSIASQMPVAFDSGRKWTEFKGECHFCKQEIPDELLRGSITRPLPSVAVVEAAGVCPQCRIATIYLYRLHEDMRITGPREDGWKTWRPEPTWWERLRNFLSLLSHRN